ncbi:hypothetical protein EPA93_04540 [Ktedonosporobacter rubrisoli]|uniref:Uncharacterized protein n=2 Tax=Ktedonosporobacter rubrisoli TaxID=2509675 RepID=A0A4P6K4U7_KTERU|nr:hypothetical protein EPA93_04540 [Ktedonosporobacter rubrisoli]
MVQVYEEWTQNLSHLGRPLETMTWAYQQICAGEDPWTGLGSFSHAWYGYAKDRRAALVNDPLVRPQKETEYTRRWAAFCAASVEFLCERYDVPCSDWVNDSYYQLSTPWSGNNSFPAITPDRMATTPPPFAKRNIFCGNRIFQNKYEMYAWTQEARAQGITDPAQVWAYARDKEIRIHGG